MYLWTQYNTCTLPSSHSCEWVHVAPHWLLQFAAKILPIQCILLLITLDTLQYSYIKGCTPSYLEGIFWERKYLVMPWPNNIAHVRLSAIKSTYPENSGNSPWLLGWLLVCNSSFPDYLIYSTRHYKTSKLKPDYTDMRQPALRCHKKLDK